MNNFCLVLSGILIALIAMRFFIWMCDRTGEDMSRATYKVLRWLSQWMVIVAVLTGLCFFFSSKPLSPQEQQRQRVVEVAQKIQSIRCTQEMFDTWCAVQMKFLQSETNR